MRSFEEWWPTAVPDCPIIDHPACNIAREAWIACAAEYQSEIERLRGEVAAAQLKEAMFWTDPMTTPEQERNRISELKSQAEAARRDGV